MPRTFLLLSPKYVFNNKTTQPIKRQHHPCSIPMCVVNDLLQFNHHTAKMIQIKESSVVQIQLLYHLLPSVDHQEFEISILRGERLVLVLKYCHFSTKTTFVKHSVVQRKKEY